jgi:hypothetical protein
MVRRGGALVLVLGLGLAAMLSPGLLVASDHDDGEVGLKGRHLNLTDLYVFREVDQVPNDAPSSESLIFIMNLNPRSVARQQYYYSTEADYEFKVGRVKGLNQAVDGTAEVILRFEFGAPNADRQQAITMTVIRDGSATVVPAGMTTPLAAAPVINTFGVLGQTVSLFAGTREDPFFFDVEQFFRVRAGLAGFGPAVGFRPACPAVPCALDFTAGYNVLSIVVRVPRALLRGRTSATAFDVWETIQFPGAGSIPGSVTVDQIERLGRPAINEGLLITNDFLNAMNRIGPRDEARALAGQFPAAAPILAEAVATLAALGNSPTRINQLVAAFLPDALRLDTTQPSGYAAGFSGLNGPATLTRGRKITDDVIDATLFVLTNGGVTADNVSYAGPNANGSGHKPLLPAFPYLAAPN